jgi:hypothetical protein
MWFHHEGANMRRGARRWSEDPGDRPGIPRASLPRLKISFAF